MKNVKVIFNDKKEIVADSYMLDKIGGHFVLRFFNPDSWEEIVDFVDTCDQSRFSLLINFPSNSCTSSISVEIKVFFIVFSRRPMSNDFSINSRIEYVNFVSGFIS